MMDRNWYETLRDMGIHFKQFVPHIDWDDCFEKREFVKYCNSNTEVRTALYEEYDKRMKFLDAAPCELGEFYV
jgi:hypothetical protein